MLELELELDFDVDVDVDVDVHGPLSIRVCEHFCI